jgi:hypothetical protein
VTREPVSEHYSSGPLGARVQAASATAGLNANTTSGGVGVAQIVATRRGR